MHTPLTPRQAEIVAVATELIAEHGIQQLTMKKVAGRMGFSEPAIYRHFASKFDILLAILAGFREQTESVIAAVNALNGTATEKVAALFDGFIAHFVARPEITSVIFAEEIFQDDERLAGMVREIMANNQKLLARIIRTGQNDGDIRADISAEDLMTVTMGGFRLIITRWRLARRAFSLQDAGRNLSQSLAKLLSPVG